MVCHHVSLTFQLLVGTRQRVKLFLNDSRRIYGNTNLASTNNEDKRVFLGREARRAVGPTASSKRFIHLHTLVSNSAPGERVAGAVYLEAAYSFALYDPKVGDWHLDLPVLQKQLELFAKQTRYSRPIVHQLIDTDLPVFLKDLQNMRDYWENPPKREPDPPSPTAADHVSFSAYRATKSAFRIHISRS